jgi:hypothetical protein
MKKEACPMRSAKHSRRLPRSYRREKQKVALVDNLVDFLYMMIGITLITCVLLLVLNYGT